MTSYPIPTLLRTESALRHTAKTVAAEARVLLDALLSPAAFITEGETMRQLLLRAAQLETSQPLLAQALRQRAARIWR